MTTQFLYEWDFVNHLPVKTATVNTNFKTVSKAAQKKIDKNSNSIHVIISF